MLSSIFNEIKRCQLLLVVLWKCCCIYGAHGQGQPEPNVVAGPHLAGLELNFLKLDSMGQDPFYLYLRALFWAVVANEQGMTLKI